ncbi:hypothetical protein SAMN02746066_03262 [Anaerosporobacter mobilis DSM 15930]|jgi:hypothetical protein|uniref:Uncharacterized protein n=1 Tax=Anaerosporobacter mobilis DSM 15930 TaxID=1120996 RepID=A0A1M7LGT5_9FIRM|nr:hypothetical protein [Anaerosporobacter mobilis]SHM77376.1 hypothetical protein SAMN02746066_03262 [Anaerosporobacter mobilis DSM 15930]
MNIKDYMNGQNAGMDYACKIAKEKGTDALVEECKFRKKTGIPITVERKKCDEAIERIKMNTIDTIRILSLCVLRDEFGFGKDRLKRFAERFEKKTDCLVDEFVNWEDIIENIKEETGLEESIRKNEVK